MTKDDLEFLKDLQHELKTQTNDGNADPVFWRVMEKKKVYKADGYGWNTTYIYNGEYECETINELVEYIGERVSGSDDVEVKGEWKYVNKDNIYDLVDFAFDFLGVDIKVLNYDMEDVLSRETGCFITKRAAQKYVDGNRHNHNEPRTFAMTAYRNFELERFLKIFKDMDLNKLETEGQ